MFGGFFWCRNALSRARDARAESVPTNVGPTPYWGHVAVTCLKFAVGQFSERVTMSNVHAALPTEVNRVIAVFPILAELVEVKTGSRSTAHWSNDFIQLNGWLRNCFAQLITPLDIDGIGQNWEDSNKKQMYLRPIRGRSRWPRGQRVADGAFFGSSLALGPTGLVLRLVHRSFTGLNE